MMNEIGQLELKLFKENAKAVAAFEAGLSHLKASGVFNLLRQFARPFASDRGESLNAAAYTAAHAEGYNQCLDDLLYFDQKFLVQKLKGKTVVPDFGGLALAVRQGNLTKEEAEKIRGRS